MHYRFRTAIPDEIDGQPITFANAFEREERPGELTVLLVADGTRTVLGVGDRFQLGAVRLRLAAIAPQENAHVVVVERLDDQSETASARAETQSFALPPIGIKDLAALLESLSPAILAALGGEGGAILDWSDDTQSTMHREWNGEEIGPVSTRRLTARLADVASKAEVAVTEICRVADIVETEEISAYWRTARRSLLVFARAEGGEMVVQLLGPADAADIVASIAAAVGQR